MGFLGRLANLGKGWAAGLGKRADTAVVEAELNHDRMHPTPGPEAEAQLAALKRQSPGSDLGDVTQDPQPPGASDDAESGEAARPKKTL